MLVDVNYTSLEVVIFMTAGRLAASSLGQGQGCPPRLRKPSTRRRAKLDPTRRTLAVQGHWWSRGVHTVHPRTRGSLVAYRVHNVASWGRWMIPLLQWRLPHANAARP